MESKSDGEDQNQTIVFKLEKKNKNTHTEAKQMKQCTFLKKTSLH